MSDEIVLKKREAIALSYDDQKMSAPKVVAKGRGELAERIIEQAKLHHIPIQEDPSLVEILSKINMNEQIPEELFQVVAEVFAFIYRVEKEASKNINKQEK